jgi:hypothetical protein
MTKPFGSIALALACIVTAGPARADEPGSADGDWGGEGRTLNGHVFMPAGVVPSPFVTTSFGSALRIAEGTSTATYTVGNDTLSGTLNYAGIGGVLAYEYAFLGHFSARLTLDEILYSGTSGKSAIVVGTTGQLGVVAGVTGSFALGDSLRLGLLFDVSDVPNAGLTIGSAIKSIIDSCQTTGCDVANASFWEQVNVITYKPTLAASWAPVPALGLTGNLAYEWSTTNSTHSGNFKGQAVVLGASADFDFKSISSVALGLQAQVRWQAPTIANSLQHVTDLGGGIFYTGRKDLALGLQVVDRQFAVVPSVKVSWSTWLFETGLRYYW